MTKIQVKIILQLDSARVCTCKLFIPFTSLSASREWKQRRGGHWVERGKQPARWERGEQWGRAEDWEGRCSAWGTQQEQLILNLKDRINPSKVFPEEDPQVERPRKAKGLP